MCPPRFPYPRDPKRSAEKQFYNACERHLDNEWTILYEQHWHGHRNAQNQRGEADFLMLSSQHGAFVVEVKGGASVEVRDGMWLSTPHGSELTKEIKNPFTQAADSKSVLWDYLRENVPTLRLKGELGHMVVFPGHRQHGDMSPQARRGLICDQDDLKDLPRTMARVGRYFSQKTRWTEEEVRLAKERLMPTFRLVGAQRGALDEFLDELERLTETQLTAFAMLRKYSTLTVHGGAGSGKTVLAFNRAQELSLNGLKVLYLCSSEPLREFLIEELSRTERATTATSLEIHSDWSLIRKVGEQSSIPVVNFPEDFVEACEKVLAEESNLFDAVVIDEAQNVLESVAFGALMLLRKGGHQYIFGDPNQSTADMQMPFEPLLGKEKGDGSALRVFGSKTPVVLNINCRSSAQIAKFADDIVGVQGEKLGTSFKDVAIVKSSMSSCAHAVAQVIREYTTSFGLGPDEITILVPPEFNVLARLFNESGNIDEDGCFVAEDLMIDWLGKRATAVDYQSFLMISKMISHYLASNIPEDLEHRWVDFNKFRGIGDGFHRKFPGLGSKHVEQIEKSLIGVPGSEHREKSQTYVTELFQLRARNLESANLPLYRSTTINEFVGLESHAVIAVLPFVPKDRKEYFHEGDEIVYGDSYFRTYLNRFDFAANVYTMVTRARALVTLIGDDHAIGFLDALSSGSDNHGRTSSGKDT